MGKKGKKAGRAGAKQKAKGRSNTTPKSTPRSRGIPNDDWDDDEPIRFKGFQGTFTPQSKTATPFAKLRHQQISFVSAGTSAPPEQLQQKSPHLNAQDDDLQLDDDLALDDSEDEESEEDDFDDSNLHTNIVTEEEVEISEKSMADMHIHTSAAAKELNVQSAAEDTIMDPEALPFVIDTVGDATLVGMANLGSRLPVKRAPSPAPSDSSEEVVLFHGRSKTTVINDPVPGSSAPISLPVRQQNGSARGWGARASKYDTTMAQNDNWSPAPENPYWKKGKGKSIHRPDLAPSAAELKNYDKLPAKQSKVQFAQHHEEENGGSGDAEQTIEALQDDWRKALREKKKLKEAEMPGSSKAATTSRRKKRGRKKDNRALLHVYGSDDDSEAAYEDYMENLKAQLDQEDGESDDALIAHLKATARPSAISGPSLVVDGKVIEDDEVLPGHMEEDDNEEAEARPGYHMKADDDSEWESDDSILNPDFDELSQDESLNASDLESDLEYTERQQWEDEDDLRQRRIEALDDETIARLLAKQEELGIDADELLIEDGSYPYISDDGFGDLTRARAGLSNISNFGIVRRSNKNGVRRERGNKGNSDFFPDATLMADTVEQYGENGFDIMDFERPSLRPTKKGRKGKLPPELEALSDEEMRDSMAVAWEKDRSAKRQKKLEREELRAEGLLGAAGRKGKADLSRKYPLGMSIHQVWSELAEFLQDDDLRERSFPPMDKRDRKALHEVAVALDLNSKSQGAGMKRFPIIYKTSMTQEYSSDQFKKVINASTRGFLTNRGAAKKMSRKAAKAANGGRAKSGGGMGAATIQHGEVVGTGAAEIGQDSFGHKLMEKMGWSKGKGLGKDGEGLLVPVEQIMRRGTAGLG